ncbi:MAG: hypothetical protein PGN34_09645 [Methylobacterium frigidaeris]
MTFVLRAGLVIGMIFYLSPMRQGPAPSLPPVPDALRERALRAGAEGLGRAVETSLRGTLTLDALSSPPSHPEATAAIR